MDNYLKQLQQKYNYDDKIITSLSKIIPELIKYYGEEHQKTIFEALANCQIHIQQPGENHNEFLNNYFKTNEDFQRPIGGDAVFSSRLKVNDGKASIKYLIYIFQPLIGEFDLSNDNDISKMIHEICHLIKGYGRLKVEQNKIVVSSGLMYKEYDLNGKKLNKSNYQINVGIEEALNCYDEEKITKAVIGHEYKSTSYNNISSLISKLMKNEELNKAIKKAQFSYDTSWMDLLGIEEAKKIMKQFDSLITMSYIKDDAIDLDEEKMFDDLSSQGKSFDEIEEIIMREIEIRTQKLWEPYHKTYKEVEHFIDNYTSQKQLSKFEQTRSTTNKNMIEKIKEIQNKQNNIETTTITR